MVPHQGGWDKTVHVHCHFLHDIMQSRSAAFLHAWEKATLCFHPEEYIIHKKKTASVLLIGHHKLLGFFLFLAVMYVAK